MAVHVDFKDGSAKFIAGKTILQTARTASGLISAYIVTADNGFTEHHFPAANVNAITSQTEETTS